MDRFSLNCNGIITSNNIVNEHSCQKEQKETHGQWWESNSCSTRNESKQIKQMKYHGVSKRNEMKTDCHQILSLPQKFDTISLGNSLQMIYRICVTQL